MKLLRTQSNDYKQWYWVDFHLKMTQIKSKVSNLLKEVGPRQSPFHFFRGYIRSRVSFHVSEVTFSSTWRCSSVFHSNRDLTDLISKIFGNKVHEIKGCDCGTFKLVPDQTVLEWHWRHPQDETILIHLITKLCGIPTNDHVEGRTIATMLRAERPRLFENMVLFGVRLFDAAI